MPPLPTKMVPLKLGGIDWRSDPLNLPPGKVLDLVNISFETPGVYRKRNGFTALGSGQQLHNTVAGRTSAAISNAKNIFSHGKRLLMETAEDLLSYDTVQAMWTPIGPAPTCQLTYEKDVPTPYADYHLADCAYNATSGLELYVFEAYAPNAGGDGVVLMHVRDAATGATWMFTADATPSRRPRAVAVGGDLVVVYGRGNTLYLKQFNATTVASANPTTGPTETSLVTDAASSILFDIASASTTGFMLAYFVNGGTGKDIKLAKYSSAGVLQQGPVTTTATNAPTVLAVAMDWNPITATGTQFICLSWAEAAAQVTRAKVFNTSMGFSLLQTFAALGGTPTNLAAVWSSSTQVHILTEVAGTATYLQQTFHAWLTTNGGTTITATSSTTEPLYRHAGLASKPFAVHNRPYVLLCFQSTLQTSFVLVRLTNQVVTQQATAAGYLQETNWVVLGRFFAGLASGLTPSPSLPQVAPLDTTGAMWRFPSLVRDRLGTAAETPPRSCMPVTFDFSAVAHWAEAGAAKFGTGLALWRADQQNVVEQGFLFYPENTTAVGSQTGGALAIGGREYIVVAEWTNANGEREQSSGIPLSVTLTGSQDTATLTIQSLTLTNKNKRSLQSQGDISLAVYRTTNGDATAGDDGTLFYRCSSPDPATAGAANGFVANVVTADTVTFVDKLSDTVLQTHEPLYFQPGAEVSRADNIAPPPTRFIAAGNGRIWLAGSQDNDELIPSLTRTFGEALNFSDSLRAEIGAGDGPITAIGVLGDTTVVWREHQIYAIGGDGPDNTISNADQTNLNGSFTPARMIASDIGCTDIRSLIRMPLGFMFYSRRGFFLLSGDLALSFVGADVAMDLTTGDRLRGQLTVPFRLRPGGINACAVAHDSHEVRFFCSDATSAFNRVLVFNYLVQAWSTWWFSGNGTAIGACIWERSLDAADAQSQFVWLSSTGGGVAIETPGVFKDGGTTAYEVFIDLGWFSSTALGGSLAQHMIVKRFLVSGVLESQHQNIVGASYDGSILNISSGDGGTLTVSDASDTPYNLEYRLKTRRCRSIHVTLEIDDSLAPSPGEAVRISEVALEVGFYPGPRPLPAASRAL